MSAPAVAEASRERELRELYSRYKGLTLATGATLLLDADPDRLAVEAGELLIACRRAAARTGVDCASQLDACVVAVRELHQLLLRAAEDVELIGAEDTERVRASHSRLRREVWKVFPCEYVPCSGAHRHSHAQER
jgi:hypothetical protein